MWLYNFQSKIIVQHIHVCLTVAGSGQVDSGVSVDFESEGIHRVGQLPAVCLLVRSTWAYRKR